ncbi:putative transmembrane alanine and glycine rich protein [Mycobacterium bohemicum DSM 44277]|uniref:Transmembrane alanine and glycine rich protein n=3 Tax=Mycobacterium bohemicum TaxID=56425 RepID=A0A1X1R3C0_MYCBE|nr:LGFP repeat-containing protein [Mycobacterium bohemicum]MCV6968892.1 LGFP repeat-containing protein [Mycobacterium bohemicum]ORU98792.1 hypothetical protein AWB93_13195 [Mycobacterium bohemicum]CPR12458.1 putative transmembrane alanine and glycine rich protein [Mycobacterium bohemicum DSM 44277]
MRKLIGSALVSLATTAVAVALLAPVAAASPIGDAEAAIMAAWEKAGGDGSPLGARKGDVYPVGDGFALDFDGGKMFYTTDTGAKFVYGPILDKYESLGGPAGSDLGFPTINEVPGLAGPDSRVATFSASDKPVIFWTTAHGAFVVRGAINAAWDKLGSSGGVLGAPVADETYDGETTSQKFSGGQVSWNRQTKEFATEPATLADQLKGLQVPIDPTAAINMAWRSAGGLKGPLGAKQGGQYPIGGDGIAQNFAGGKVFFSPATGANAVESDILAKYESLGGPAGSDLGFPVANESDGGLGPSSRICTFSAADKPVIFWTPDHGAFVVRGAMKAAWDKLRGPSGKLGAPVGDQAVDGDVISQSFTGGKISWNRAKNSFSTDPANLAPLLSGLQVPGQNQASGAAPAPGHAKKFTWQWWWLLAAIPVLVLIVLSALVAFGWRRRRSEREAASYQPEHDLDGGYDDYPFGDLAAPDHPTDDEPARVSWGRGPAAVAADDGRDPDEVDTDSIPVLAGHPGYDEAGYRDAGDAGYDDAGYEDAGYDDAGYDDYEAGYSESAHAEAHPEAHLDVEAEPEGSYLEHEEAAHPEAGYERGGADEDEQEGEPVGYPDVAAPHADEALATPEAAAPEAHTAEALVAAAAFEPEPRTGRHAAPGTEEPVPAGAVRPTIHLPLDDPYQVPDGYPIKANTSFGLYYTPGSALYHDTLAEIWLSTEEVAQANGFIKAD